MGGACSAYGGRGEAYRVLVEKHEGNRQLGRSTRRWENNIKMDLQEMRLGVWTGLSWLKIRTGDGHL